MLTLMLQINASPRLSIFNFFFPPDLFSATSFEAIQEFEHPEDSLLKCFVNVAVYSYFYG